jgi:hypothetical protein
MALFAGSAQALSTQECGALEGNQFLAAVERGTCRIDIETAAGPEYIYVTENGGDDDHKRRGGEGGGHHDDGGDGGDGGTGGSRDPNGGRAGAKP